jgi:hypothetical protein
METSHFDGVHMTVLPVPMHEEAAAIAAALHIVLTISASEGADVMLRWKLAGRIEAHGDRTDPFARLARWRR